MLKIREPQEIIFRFSIEHLFQPEASWRSNAPPHMVPIHHSTSNDANIDVYVGINTL
jgi:hypothetical protein